MAKQLSQEELKAQIVAEMNAEFDLKQKQRELNVVSMGARVQKLEVKHGAPIIDKQSGQQKEVNGVPQTYADKYFVTLQAMGVELETEVNKTAFENLEQFKMYLCEGYVGEVKKFGNSYIEPIFQRFTAI